MIYFTHKSVLLPFLTHHRFYYIQELDENICKKLCPYRKYNYVSWCLFTKTYYNCKLWLLQATHNWTVLLNPRSEHTLVSRTFEIVSRWVWGFRMSFLGKAFHLLSVFCGYTSAPKTDWLMRNNGFFSYCSGGWEGQEHRVNTLT